MTLHTFNEEEFSSKIDSAEFRALFKTSSLKHGLAILYNWIIIGLTIWATIHFQHVALYIASVFVIGARMHALAILMHDAAHYRFLKNRKWNDALTNYLTMYLIFTSVAKYRANHLKHHRHLNTDDDPDWAVKLGNRAFTFPKTKGEFLLTLCSYLVLYQGIADALWFLKRFNTSDKKGTTQQLDLVPRIIYYGILFSAITFLGIWKYYIIFWIIPYFSTFFMFQYIRSVAEHFGELAYDHSLTSTRTVKTNLIESFLLAPHNVGYHLEHHLYPAVPFYHLPKLHKLLMSQPEYKSKAHITQGYTVGLMNELGKAH